MILPRNDDRRSSLERLTHDGARRRPRHGIEGQAPRCPICNKVMIPYVGRAGPRFHCGCDEANGTNGNGHHGEPAA
jgi:hypothetical protein